MSSDGEALTGLWLDGQKNAPALPLAAPRQLPVFGQTAAWLDCYFSGGIPVGSPPLRLHGTAFQLAVWSQLLQIPYGETTTYGALAEQLSECGRARPAAQAVGGAVGRNPVLLLVPCHRVVGADGSPTGYAGGLEKKRWLLRLEQKQTRSEASRRAAP